jgi:hypothetical protein
MRTANAVLQQHFGFGHILEVPFTVQTGINTLIGIIAGDSGSTLGRQWLIGLPMGC